MWIRKDCYGNFFISLHYLINTFKAISTWAQEEFIEIVEQVNTIETESNADISEFIEGLPIIFEEKGFDLNDPRQTVDAILASFETDYDIPQELMDCQEGSQFVKIILQHLLIPARMAEGKMRF